jgi:hypothetical protein
MIFSFRSGVLALVVGLTPVLAEGPRRDLGSGADNGCRVTVAPDTYTEDNGATYLADSRPAMANPKTEPNEPRAAERTGDGSGGQYTNEHAGPPWADLKAVWNHFMVNTNGYPESAMFGSNKVGIPQTLVGAQLIPAISKSGNAAFAVAGYSITNSKITGANGLFGYGGIGVDGDGTHNPSAWGGSSGVSNSFGLQSETRTGHDFANLYGWEIDANLRKRQDGSAPNNSVRGLYVNGDAEVQTPNNVVYGIDVDHLGSTLGIPWKVGFHTSDGGSIVGISLGSLLDNEGPTTSAAQPIVFNSYLRGALRQSSVSADGSGDLLIAPYEGTSTVLTDGAAHAVLTVSATGASAPILISTIKMVIPFHTPQTSSEACETGQIATNASYLYTCIATNTWHRVSNGNTW